MTSVLLGNMLAYPLHVASWSRPRGSVDYRVTNTFNGRDFLNGGTHQATDVGNFRGGDAVKAPVACAGLGLRHTDGALGVRFNLGMGVTIDLWHLSKVSIPGDRWTPLAKGQAVGATGNTGARLPDGSPMPFHTHIRAERNRVPFDIEPHLPMVERPAKALLLEDTDMKIPNGEALVQAVLGQGNRLRVDPNTAEGSRVIGTDIGEPKAYWVQVYQRGVKGQPYTLGGKAGDQYAFVGVFGQAWFVAEPLLTNWTPVSGLFPPADCSRQDNALAGIRTAVAGAQQALTAIEGLAKA